MKPLALSVEGDGAASADGNQPAERSAVARPTRVVYVVLLTTMFWGVIFFLYDSTSFQLGNATFFSQLKIFQFGLSDKCAGRYLYMYDLPPRFNADLVGDCRGLNASTDWCKHAANGGFGPVITGGGGELPERGAYDTDQYSLSMIFHARMKRHECLTYIPFYAGLDVWRFLGQEHNDSSASDALSRGLVEWLLARPEWRAMGGCDHFLVVARGSWDFLGMPDVPGRGNSLMNYPAIRNTTVLTSEASPWHGIDFAVPFPSHFHASSDADVASWQGRMRRLERKWLWGFTGGARNSHGGRQTVRSQIIEQCARSSRCGIFPSPPKYTPGRAMQLLESVEFCVQPRGDAFTRKSTFDGILAGCIPVFFPVSTYLQYIWHLPRDYRSYSVLINHADVATKNTSIEEVLAKIPPAKVAQMREEVIRLIPTVMYRDPAAKGVTFKDAFNVAVDAVIHRMDKRRRAAAEGRECQDSVDGGNSSKYDLLQDGDKDISPHEFDVYF